MKHCPNCGAGTEEGQKFCGECGARLAFDPLPAEPVYTDDERLKNDPALSQRPEPAPAEKKETVPELTLEPDLWGLGTAAAAETAPALPVEQQEAPSFAPVMAEIDYERPDAEYHGPAQGTEGDFHAAPCASSLPNDYTMSQSPQRTDAKTPNETLMLVWSIILTCLCSICGIVGLVKTVKARGATDPGVKSKLLSSAQIWLIVGTALRVLPFLANLF